MTNVRVSNAKLELPASSSRSVQSLEDAPGVVIAETLGPPKKPRKPGALPLEFDIVVNKTFVTSAQLKIALRSVAPPRDESGKPHESGPYHRTHEGLYVLLADRLYTSGDIRLIEGGTVSVNFREFRIEHGLVRLREEDAANPYVNLTARWDDDDSNTRVYIDYNGLLSPITDDKIRLRSDPAMGSTEIVQRLLLGQGDANETNYSGAVAGLTTSQLLGNLFGERFQLRVGFGEGQNQIGGVYKFDGGFSLGGGVRQKQGDDTTSTTANKTAGNCEDLFFEWRFRKRWSLRGASGVCNSVEDGQDETNQEFNLGADVLGETRY